ncbi:MAG: ribonuclease P protein component [Candidatus Krumholzibacteria bacterium]|nr:ribonuclease P protein component [Candidatus Krumholzibacteria bacterium]
MALEPLKKSWQFRVCYGRGRRVVCRDAVVFCARAPEEGDGPRVGVVASKRVGGAVQRSRAKRLLRETSRYITGRLNDPNTWLVLVAKSSIVARTAREVQDDIERSLAEAGLVARGIE